MKKYEIVDLYQKYINIQKTLDSGLPVSFETEMAEVKKLNERILDIFTGQNRDKEDNNDQF